MENYLEAHIKNPKLEDIESINIPESYAVGLNDRADEGSYLDFFRSLIKDPVWKDKIKVIKGV